MSAPEVPLSDWPIGAPALLVAVRTSPAADDRRPAPDLTTLLARLGLRVGMRVTPVQRTPGRGLVVAVGDLRLAVDRRTAESLTVHAPAVHAPAVHAPDLIGHGES